MSLYKLPGGRIQEFLFLGVRNYFGLEASIIQNEQVLTSEQCNKAYERMKFMLGMKEAGGNIIEYTLAKKALEDLKVFLIECRVPDCCKNPEWIWRRYEDSIYDQLWVVCRSCGTHLEDNREKSV
jgi:hypothetical protein